MTAGELTQNWFEAYLSVPIIMAFYIVFKLWKKTKFKKVSEIDVTSGRREMNLKEILAEERAEQANWPKWKRWYHLVC